jgi:hypothetical protein
MKPTSENGSFLAVCQFKAESTEKPVCFTLASFDKIRQSLNQDAEKKNP